MRTSCGAVAALLSVLVMPAVGAAQPIGAVGTRAQGMGGAFVGVADDATAVYWNPAGLAGGAFFSLVLDGHTSEAVPGGRAEAGRRASWLLALSTPALGLTYYRLSHDAVAPQAGNDEGEGFRRDSLVTHHIGATLVQSIADGLAVGTTLKLVRGIAGSAFVPTRDRDYVLEELDLIGRTGSRADLDVGVMARGSLGSLGLVLRNVTEPSFGTPAGREIALQRQVRAGGSILLLPDWKVASDVDLTRTDGPLGPLRELSVGTEGQVTRRLAARAGIRVNTAGDRGRAPSVSIGASFALYGSILVDGQVTTGPDEAFRGWGLAGRMAF